jgi:hypothetical protein
VTLLQNLSCICRCDPSSLGKFFLTKATQLARIDAPFSDFVPESKHSARYDSSLKPLLISKLRFRLGGGRPRMHFYAFSVMSVYQIPRPSSRSPKDYVSARPAMVWVG